MKKISLLILLIVFFGCTATMDKETDVMSENKVIISENVYFDNTTKRYVFNGDSPSTRSTAEWAEAESIARENALLDSLCEDAANKGIKPIVIYAKSKKKHNSVRPHMFPDDSTGTWGPEEPSDTSATYTTSGTLRRNQSAEEPLNISTDYQVDVDGFCSLTYSGLINTVNYKTYHNLSVVVDDGRQFILTGESDPSFPQDTHVFLSGTSFPSPVNTLYLGYTNSDSFNDKSIVWQCDYCILAYVPYVPAN